MKNKTDILFLTLPWWDMAVPYCAPAVLKGIVESRGYTLKHYDTSVDLLNKFAYRDKGKYNEFAQYFLSSDLSSNLIVKEFYTHVINKIKSFNFRFLAISVFSVYTHRATLELLSIIRKELPEVSILVGGRGLTTRPFSFMATGENQIISETESLIDFYQILKKRSLSDYYILGDGEDAIIDLLENNTEQSEFIKFAHNKLVYPFSNFDDINFDDYLGTGNNIQLPVVSSKGCVRNCDFCDVATQMKKFISKDGDRFAEEIIYLKEKYGLNHFAMMDSISNGNMKELKKTCQKLSEYNKDKNKKDKIYWSGSWIARYPGNIKEDVFKLLKDSGCESLQIGAESGSNHVLDSMNKKSSVEGLYYELDLLHKNKISVDLMTIIGHWSEEYKDFTEHLRMLVKLGPYFAAGTIHAMYVNIFQLLHGTPADTEIWHNGIVKGDSGFSNLWHSEKNPNLTYKTRLARMLIFYDLLDLVYYPIDNFYEKMLFFNSTTDSLAKKYNSFFEDRVKDKNFQVCKTFNLLGNTKEFFQKMLWEEFPISKFHCIVNSFSCQGQPRLQIVYNGDVIYDQLLVDGLNKIDLNLENNFEKKNKIELKLANKTPNDTIVDQNGNILSDKKIEFESLILDEVDFLKNPKFFYEETTYIEDGKKLELSKPGLYRPSSLIIEYEAPFWRHYLKQGPDLTAWRSLNNFEQAQYLRKQLTKKLDLLKY